MKKQKCIIRKKIQGGDITKALKGISWFQHAKQVCICKSFSKDSGKTLYFQDSKQFPLGGLFAGFRKTAWWSQDSSYWTNVLRTKATTVIGINCNWH